MANNIDHVTGKPLEANRTPGATQAKRDTIAADPDSGTKAVANQAGGQGLPAWRAQPWRPGMTFRDAADLQAFLDSPDVPQAQKDAYKAYIARFPNLQGGGATPTGGAFK